MNNILVIGSGKMGLNHVRRLEQRQDYIVDSISLGAYGTFGIRGGRTQLLESYDYLIIATPTISHYHIYKKYKDMFPFKKILIEKPAIFSPNQLDIFDDKRVCVGLIERFNPNIAKFDSNDVAYLHFVRSVLEVRGDIFLELAIHDLDLFVYLFHITNIEDVKIKEELSFENNKLLFQVGYHLTLEYKGIPVHFCWTISDKPERYLWWRTNKQISEHRASASAIEDWTDKHMLHNELHLYNYEVDKLTLEHDAFLADKMPDTRLSHELMLKVIC